MENAKIYTSDEVTEITKSLPEIKVGDTVAYNAYSEERAAKVIRLSRDGTILFLDNNRWVSRISARKVGEQK